MQSRGSSPWRRLVATWAALGERAGLVAPFDLRVVTTLVLVALLLTFQEYYGRGVQLDLLFGSFARQSRYAQLGRHAWWAGSKVVGYLLVPALVVRLGWRERLSAYGLSVAGMRRHLFIYVALFLGVLPLVLAASYTRPFLATYPFYRDAGRSLGDLVAWELMYGASFLALEFFFRGFMLFALERALGTYAIFFMIVPYCMIHFGKPVAEVCGAIFAGIILGTLALVTRSIWCGVLIHVSVAWTMDLLALAHTHRLPSRW